MTVTEHPATDDSATEDRQAEDAAEQLVERVFNATVGAMEAYAAYAGNRLGWYAAIDGAARTSTEVAEATGTYERYAREWLEHQTVSGYIACENPSADGSERRYVLPAGHRDVLTDPTSLSFVLPLALFAASSGRHLDALVDAYRTGGGVSWDTLGDDAREAQAGMNRPMFQRQLGPEYFASIPEIHEVLARGGRVADIGAGYGWSSIGLAQAYPTITVDAFDVDGPSIEQAARNIAEAGLADRVTAECVDARTLPPSETYDLVTAFECVHDMPDPVSVLAAMRGLAGDDGIVVVMDERVRDEFSSAPDDVERIMYGFSLICCLPDGKAHGPSVETGTVMRKPTFERYAAEAGFSGVQVLPIENDFFRFYRLEQ